MLDKDSKKIRLRMHFIAVMLFLVFVMLIAWAYFLQVVEGERHKRFASKLTSKPIVIQPRRGLILDRKKIPLTGNIETPTLVAEPCKMSKRERIIAKRLLKQVFKSKKQILKRIDDPLRKFAYLHRRVSEEKFTAFNAAMEAVVENLPKGERLEEIRWSYEDKRVYPLHFLAAPVLGFTNISLKGRMGIEKRFNDDMTAEPVEYTGMQNNKRDTVVEILDVPPEVPVGDNVILTIDRGIQYAAERVIRATVEKYEARFGTAIVMEPGTGAILAMAQWPSFDPNDFSNVDFSAVHNFAIEEIIEPGSTLKPLIISAAMEKGLVEPDSIIDCGNGRFVIGRETIRDTKRHGELTVSDIVSLSSNIGAAKIGLMLGNEEMYKWLTAFGFGLVTGIRLPKEHGGLLKEGGKWQPFETATISFGQGLNVTPLQLCSSLAIIANGGLYVAPRVVERVETPDGKVKKKFKSETRRVIGKKVSRLMIEMMERVVAPGGTGSGARLDDCQVAGKTGTSEKLRRNELAGRDDFWTSIFGGFLPASDPKLLVLVVVDEPKGEHYGGVVAGPAFREIVEEVAPILGICTGSQVESEIRP